MILESDIFPLPILWWGYVDSGLLLNVETGSHELVILSYATVFLHPSVSLNNEKNCRAISVVQFVRKLRVYRVGTLRIWILILRHALRKSFSRHFSRAQHTAYWFEDFDSVNLKSFRYDHYSPNYSHFKFAWTKSCPNFAAVILWLVTSKQKHKSDQIWVLHYNSTLKAFCWLVLICKSWLAFL